MVNNIERVVVPSVAAGEADNTTTSYTVRVMAYELVEADYQVRYTLIQFWNNEFSVLILGRCGVFDTT